MSTTPPLVPAEVTVLAPFAAAGVLDAASVHVAAALARAVPGLDGPVALAAALAARAPQHGHVCVVPAEVVALLADDDRLVGDIGALPWPEPSAWVTAIEASPAVRHASTPPTGDLLPLVWDGARLYLERYWRYEQAVAAQLRQRASSVEGLAAPGSALEAALDAHFGPDDVTTPDRQRLAAATALTRSCSVIAGGPGTGKTRTIARLLAAAHELAATRGRPLDVALAAPTGKAAARMTEAVHAEVGAAGLPPAVAAPLIGTVATTIHRLLGSLGGVEFRHDRRNPLPHDLVIIDETSMVSLPLTARLLDAVRPEATVVLVGDPFQLTSVEAGAVLGEVVAAGAGPLAAGPLVDRVVVLERVHRFGADSAIAALADAIRTGDADAALGVLTAADGDGSGPPGADGSEVRWVHTDDPAGLAACHRLAADAAVGVVEAARDGDATLALARATDTKVLCATRLGPLGSYAWRERIEAHLAVAVPDAEVHRRWYVGRPVIVTRNDYPNRLVNGDTGILVAGDPRASVVFPAGDELRHLAMSQLAAVETWWSMTVHKSQGSEFRHVIVALPEPPSPVLTRELLYTAVTRAKGRVTLVASEAAIRAAVGRPAARASGLADALRIP